MLSFYGIRTVSALMVSWVAESPLFSHRNINLSEDWKKYLSPSPHPLNSASTTAIYNTLSRFLCLKTQTFFSSLGMAQSLKRKHCHNEKGFTSFVECLSCSSISTQLRKDRSKISFAWPSIRVEK